MEDNSLTFLEDTTITDVLKTFEGFYAQGDYPNALLTLEKNQDQISSEIWQFNMGIVQAKLQNFPEARFHFLKASHHGLRSNDVFNNLKIVEEKLEINRLENPLTTSDYVIRGSLWAADGFLTTISLLILLLGMIKYRKRLTQKNVLGLALGILAPILINFWIHSWDKVVVVKSQLIQEGPSVIFPSRGELPLGVLVITKDKGDWKEIIYPARFEGWIKNTGLKSLE